MNAEIEGRYVAEVTFWLNLSNYFYESFIQVKRHPGPLWFVINVIARQADDERTFGRVLDRLDEFRLFGRNGQSDLTNWLEHLRERGYVEVFDTSVVPNVEVKHPQADKKVFHVDHEIQLTELFESAYLGYVQRLCEELFGWQSRRYAESKSLLIFNEVFEFMRTKYVPLWNSFLDALAVATKPENSAPMRKELVGSAEYFVLLHVLWAARLRGGNSKQLSQHAILQRCHRVRALSEVILRGCIELLQENGLIEEEKGRHSLSASCVPAYEAYGVRFLQMRSELKSHLRGAFPALAPET